MMKKDGSKSVTGERFALPTHSLKLICVKSSEMTVRAPNPKDVIVQDHDPETEILQRTF